MSLVNHEPCISTFGIWVHCYRLQEAELFHGIP